MIKSFLFGFIAGIALLLGAVIGIVFKPSKRIAAMIMGFGSGVLISALTFDLIEDAYHVGGIIPISIGIIIGSISFVLIDWIIGKRGAHFRKHIKGKRSVYRGKTSSLAITFGALLDGIPESIMIGAGILAGKGKGILLFAAVFLSNIPEGISGVYGITKGKKSRRFIMSLWILIALACGVASFLGYTLLSDASGKLLSLVSAIAAGSILAMITDTMIPEAYEEGGVFVALSTVLGFLCAFEISNIT